MAVNEKAEYEIWDPAGVAIPNLNPPLSLNDNNSARKVIQRLVHLTKYSNVKGIENLDPASPLSRKVVAEIFKAPPGFEPGDRPTNLESVTSDGNVNVARVGQKLILRIRNNTDKVLNLTVFDLQPDYGITQVYPTIQDGDFIPIDGRGREEYYQLNADLPPTYAEGRDTIKVIVAIY